MAASADTTNHSSDFYTSHPKETFTDMELPRRLLKGVFSYGFDKPSAVQSIAIHPVKDGRDVIV
jgi:translation initiation factor 4A